MTWCYTPSWQNMISMQAHSVHACLLASAQNKPSMSIVARHAVPATLLHHHHVLCPRQRVRYLGEGWYGRKLHATTRCFVLLWHMRSPIMRYRY